MTGFFQRYVALMRSSVLSHDDRSARATKPELASARGSASGRSDPGGQGVLNPSGPASHKDGTLTLSLRGGLTYTCPHDRDPNRLRPLLHRQAGPRRPKGRP